MMYVFRNFPHLQGGPVKCGQDVLLLERGQYKDERYNGQCVSVVHSAPISHLDALAHVLHVYLWVGA